MKKFLIILITLYFSISTNSFAKKFSGWHFAEFQRCAISNQDFLSIYQCGVRNSDRGKYGYEEFILYVRTLKEAVEEGGIGNSTAKLKLLEHCETVQSKIVSMALFGVK